MSEGFDQGEVLKPVWHRRPLVRIGLWAVAGAAVGYPVGALIADYEGQIPALAAATGWLREGGWLNLAALLTALAMVGLGLWLLAISTLRDDRLRRLLQMHADDSVNRTRRMLPIGGWGMLLYAAILAIFLVPGLSPVVGVAIGVGCFAGVTWLFYRGTALMDELERAAQNEAIIATFLVVEAIGLAWALLHHYGLAPPLAPLALALAMIVIYFAAAMVAGFRRGLGE